MQEPSAEVRVCVHGLGHIGLPTALLLAHEHDVVGVDVDADRVAHLQSGDLPLDEPGLTELFEGATERGSFEARTDPVPADVHVLTVPTPLDRATNVADLGAVRAAAESVGEVLRPDDLVVLESTAPPTTTAGLLVPILRATSDVADPLAAYCPERAMPPRTVSEMVENDRIVGGTSEEATALAAALYEGFVEGAVHRTDATTAEFVKLVENTQRDVDIALANEFAVLAERTGIDVHEAISLANRHPRVQVLDPGPGVGGHCITVDPWFLTGEGEARLIPMAREVNDTMPDHVARLVRRTLSGPTATARVALFGVAYKGNVGDTRETPARRIVRRLENEGCAVTVHDPHVETGAFDRPLVDAETAVDGADCLLVVTDHDAFRELDPTALAERMATPRVVDTRNLLDHGRWADAGFDVTVLGDGSRDGSANGGGEP